MIIQTQTGSATSSRPSAQRGVIIAHIVNSSGAWVKGFVKAVDDLSLAPKQAYREFCSTHKNAPLGVVQFIEVQPNLFVANMFAQNGIDRAAVPGGVLVDYTALEACLVRVLSRAVLLRCDLSIPAGMGSCLAGGDKSKILGMIETIAQSKPIATLESHLNFVPTITLWEFTDTNAASYVGGPVVMTNKPKVAVQTGDPVVDGVNNSLNKFCDLDITEDNL